MTIKNLGVIGLGRLGLCFALTLESAGFNVYGHDIREDHLSQITNKTFNSSEPGVTEKLLKSKNLKVDVNLKNTVDNSDVIFVTVATYSEEDGRYDVSQVDSVVDNLISLGNQSETRHLVICSNVNPGYTDGAYDKLKGYNWKVSFNPETVAQGTILKNQSEPDCVYIGTENDDDAEQIRDIYLTACTNNPVVHTMDRLSAELTKVSLNCYLTCKISFTNMIGDLATKIGANPEKVLAAVGSDSRINNKFFRYGFGWGGPCFPRDTRALIRLAKNNDMPYYMCLASNLSNEEHLNFQINEFLQTGKKKYYTDTVTYKKGSPILEESQQLKFAESLARIGIEVTIDETEEVTNQLKEIYGDLFKYV